MWLNLLWTMFNTSPFTSVHNFPPMFLVFLLPLSIYGRLFSTFLLSIYFLFYLMILPMPQWQTSYWRPVLLFPLFCHWAFDSPLKCFFTPHMKYILLMCGCSWRVSCWVKSIACILICPISKYILYPQMPPFYSTSGKRILPLYSRKKQATSRNPSTYFLVLLYFWVCSQLPPSF